MLRTFSLLILMIAGFLAFPGNAFAVCSSPSGNAGDVLYNDAQSVLQYCDNTNWINVSEGPKSGGGCIGPAGTKGQVVYNADYRIPQYCNGFEWVGMAAATTGSAGIPGGWTQITAGGQHTCGIKSDGKLWCWGDNFFGQLGDNSNTDRVTPTAINGGGSWKQIAAGWSHTCGIKSDDTIRCWGQNTNGQIGDNTSANNRLVPTALNGGGTWKQVAVGISHSCGIKSDDTLWCWGNNSNGQIGDNTQFTDRLVPTAINGGGTWKQVGAGEFYTCGIKTDDTIWCWGINTYKQLGTGSGSTADKLIPTAVSGGGAWNQVALGQYSTCGIKTDNSLWCWGDNSSGQLGDNSTTQRNIPTAISGGGTWKKVDAGSGHACAIKSDDSLWCWGWNGHGQIGDGSLGGNLLVPTAVSGGGAWYQISAGSQHSCGIKTGDVLSCWGSNDRGRIASEIERLVPTTISGGGTWKQIAAGVSHACGIKLDNTLWCWGFNGTGQVGDNSTTMRLVPTAINGGGTWKQVAAGYFHTCGIKTDDSLWCWGGNGSGQLGDNSTTTRLVPTAVNGGGTWKQVVTKENHTCGIKSDDSLYCWGYNFYGQIGDNTSGTNRDIPTAVNGGGTWKQISTGGNHSCGIKADDTFWCWGYGPNGQLGSGTSSYNVPTQVTGGGTWKQVTTGGNHSCGIKADDSLWCWGANSYGEVGDDTSGTSRTVPTAINGGGTWKQVDAGDYYTCSIKSDDTIWCWGYNADGAVGDNSTANRDVPTALANGGTWKQVATGANFACGIKSDDTVWCWGSNSASQLTATEYSSPNRLTATNLPCANPFGMAGEILYNGALNVLQFCNGSSWVSLGKKL